MNVSHWLIGLSLLLSNVEVDSPIYVRPNQFRVITAKTQGEMVKFFTVDQIAIFPSGQLIDKKSTVIFATKEGKYRLFAYSSVNNIPTDPIEIIVIVGEAPGPGPNPPDPEPEPLSPLASQLKPYVSDPLDELISFWKTASEYAQRKEFTTFGQLDKAVREISSKIKGNTALRQEIGKILQKRLPLSASTMLDEYRPSVISAYLEISQALLELKNAAVRR